MSIRFITFLISACFSLNASAENCNLKNLEFGITQENLKTNFILDTLNVSEIGDAIITVPAREICKEIPDGAIIEFSLIDNKFVQMSIISKGTNGELLNYSQKTFGERDNIPTDPKKAVNQKVKTGLWAKDIRYNVVYNTYTAGRYNFEKLVISSSKYKELFEKSNNEKGQAADDYLKEHKLGAYNPSNTDKMPADSINSANDNTTTAPIKNLKEKENERGYHYGN